MTNVLPVQFKAIFETLPIVCAVLTPELRIGAATDTYLAAGQKKRDEVLGEIVYEIFPDSALNNGSVGAKTLKSSLENVLATAQADDLGVIRYDVELPDGSYAERWWRPINIPIHDTQQQLKYIIHLVEDVNNLIGVLQQAEQAAKARGMTKSLINQFFS